MKLSEAIAAYLITSWTEGVHVITWEQRGSDEDPTLTCSYSDEHGYEYSADFKDQDIVFDGAPGLFVVQCDGQPWQFKAWVAATNTPEIVHVPQISSAPAQVVLHLDGGVVQDVRANAPLTMVVLDHDCDGADDDDVMSLEGPALTPMEGLRRKAVPGAWAVTQPDTTGVPAVFAAVDHWREASA